MEVVNMFFNPKKDYVCSRSDLLEELRDKQKWLEDFDGVEVSLSGTLNVEDGVWDAADLIKKVLVSLEECERRE